LASSSIRDVLYVIRSSLLFITGALALHTALRSSHKLGGCIALSSWLPLRGEYPAALSEASKSLPILQVHGDEDMVVNYAWGAGTGDLLKTMITSPSPKFLKIRVHYL
jgi:predicted esterase